MTTSALQEFEARVAALKKKGLVDLKFYAGEVADSDTESFCGEANSLLSAVEDGLTEQLDFGDSTR